jgi:hypothetical protein
MSTVNRVTLVESREALEVFIKPDPLAFGPFHVALTTVVGGFFVYSTLYTYAYGILPFGMQFRGGGPPNVFFFTTHSIVSIMVVGLLIHQITWQLGGMEKLTLDREKLTRTRSRFGFGHTDTFDPAQLKTIEVTPTNSQRPRGPFLGLGFDSFGLRFEARGRMVYLISGLEQQEAQEIMDRLRAFKPAARA